MKQLQLNELVKLTQAKNTKDAGELAEQGYAHLLEHWCADDNYDSYEACKGITGAVLVNTVMWMGERGCSNALRCYTNYDVLVPQDADGGLWMTQEQEKEYLL